MTTRRRLSRDPRRGGLAVAAALALAACEDPRPAVYYESRLECERQHGRGGCEEQCVDRDTVYVPYEAQPSGVGGRELAGGTALSPGPSTVVTRCIAGGTGRKSGIRSSSG